MQTLGEKETLVSLEQGLLHESPTSSELWSEDWEGAELLQGSPSVVFSVIRAWGREWKLGRFPTEAEELWHLESPCPITWASPVDFTLRAMRMSQ